MAILLPDSDELMIFDIDTPDKIMNILSAELWDHSYTVTTGGGQEATIQSNLAFLTLFCDLSNLAKTTINYHTKNIRQKCDTWINTPFGYLFFTSQGEWSPKIDIDHDERTITTNFTLIT
jgi:hypothetical protein